MKSEGRATLTLLEDASVLASGVNPINDVYVIEAPLAPGPLRAMLLEVMPDPSLPSQGPGRAGDGTIALTGVSVSMATEDSVAPLEFGKAAADIREAVQAIDGNTNTFWGIYPEVAKPHRLQFSLQEPTTIPENARIVIRLEALHGQYNNHNLGRSGSLGQMRRVAEGGRRLSPGVGHADRVKELLDQANTWIKEQRDQYPDNAIPDGHAWQDWAVFLTLQQEAETLINGKPEPKPPGGDGKPAAAVPGKSPPPDKPSDAPSKPARK